MRLSGVNAYLRGAGGRRAFARTKRPVLFTHDFVVPARLVPAGFSGSPIATVGIYVATALPECSERNPSHHGPDSRWSDGRATRLEAQRCPNRPGQRRRDRDPKRVSIA